MTREEQIKQAAREYATHLTDTGEMDYHGHFEKEIKFNPDEYRVFIAGAEWADNNTVNVYHDTSEEPKLNQWLLAQMGGWRF